MKPFLNNGAKIELKPDPGWNWEGWDGVMEVSALHNPVKIFSKDIIHENDVPMFKLLPGRIYKATGFSDIPGIINSAFFMVDGPTLSDKIKVNGSFPLLISSTGKFTCNFTTPSFKTTPGGPVPDPLPIKTGKWKVVSTNQMIAFRSLSKKDFMGISISGSSDFISITMAFLEAIKSTPTGLALLSKIAKSPQKVTIVEETLDGNACGYANPSDRYLNDDGSPGVGTDATVYFNSNVTVLGTEDWERRPPAIGLAHELVHAQQAQTGTMKKGKANNDHKFIQGSKTEFQQAKINELEAVGIDPYEENSFSENKIRDEWNPPQPKRKWY